MPIVQRSTLWLKREFILTRTAWNPKWNKLSLLSFQSHLKESKASYPINWRVRPRMSTTHLHFPRKSSRTGVRGTMEEVSPMKQRDTRKKHQTVARSEYQLTVLCSIIDRSNTASWVTYRSTLQKNWVYRNNLDIFSFSHTKISFSACCHWSSRSVFCFLRISRYVWSTGGIFSRGCRVSTILPNIHDNLVLVVCRKTIKL